MDLGLLQGCHLPRIGAGSSTPTAAMAAATIVESDDLLSAFLELEATCCDALGDLLCRLTSYI